MCGVGVGGESGFECQKIRKQERTCDDIFVRVGFGVVFEKEREVAKSSILGLNTGVGRVKVRIYKLLSGAVFMVGFFLRYDVTFQNLKIKIRRDFLMIGEAYQDRVALLVFRFWSTFLFSWCDFSLKLFAYLFSRPRRQFLLIRRKFLINTFYFKDFSVLFTIAKLFSDFYSGQFLSIFWHHNHFLDQAPTFKLRVTTPTYKKSTSKPLNRNQPLKNIKTPTPQTHPQPHYPLYHL